MNYLISRNEALKLLKKYGINKSIDDLKSKEVIQLTPYDKFRKENIELINAFNKINDSINFKVMRSEEYFFYVDKKINR
ncbi:hypothetical protein KHA90_18160 [Flavobacterium psychroterrae]|uniref:Uncharacterized protein n=1 Tax=Flavobacterium psychroterrae TaxID=2133767 RepID=A0ABS5PF67_9FLAO|nr:hypothetical protein [Flavobacterium psychroterrae]MBS7232948.1 hypothetical protein [Flavobacterium psychroterrae]